MKLLISIAIISFAVLLFFGLQQRYDVPDPLPDRQLPVSQSAPAARETPAPDSLIWTPVTAIDVPEDFRRPAIDDVAYLSISGLELLAQGDLLTLMIPQEDTAYSGRVEQITISPSGNRSLSGSFQVDDQTNYPFLITLGYNQTFATLNTPAGQYQLQGRDGIGRLIPTASIKAKLDYSKPDYVIPDRLKPVNQG